MGLRRRYHAGILDAWRIAGEPTFFERGGPRKGLFRRFWDCARIGLIDGVPFLPYNCFGADRKGVDPFDFIRYPSDMMRRVYLRNLRLDPESVKTLEDKRLFARRMVAAGLSSACTFAEGDANGNLTADGVPVSWQDLELRLRTCADGFFFKRPSFWGGKGVSYVKFDGKSFVSSGELFDLAAAVRDGDCLFQLPIRQIAEMAALNKSSVNTLRIVTVRSGDRFELLLPAIVRIGRAGACADNIGSGGVAVGVKEDGRLLDWGIVQNAANLTTRVRCHPDYGYRFGEKKISHYREALDLAIACHRQFPKLLAVGWDVAISENGPVLIEGNAKFGIDLNEIVHRLPAGPKLEAAWRCCSASVQSE